MSLPTPALIALLVLVYIFWRCWPKGESKRFTRQVAPDAIYGTWRIEYVDIHGEITHRVIRIREVMPNVRKIKAWCELRQDNRTFLLESIIQAHDVSSDSPVDIHDWLLNYRRSRRKPAK